MPRRSIRNKRNTQSGAAFGSLPRFVVVHVLKFFDIYEVARLQRFVCREFRDAGQVRIRERGGRTLLEKGFAKLMGCNHQIIDTVRGELLLDASCEAGCRLDTLSDRMDEDDLSDEEKQNILKELKEIATASPYHWVYFYIANWYRMGFGGEEKKKQAVVWWNKAANGGNTDALYNLAHAYEMGNLGLTQSLTQSPTKANELYALAAEKGHACALYNLGCSYRDGEGVEVDFNRCVELLEQSAIQGYVHAQFALAVLFRDGSQDNENGNPMTVPKNNPLHFKWASAAAKQGDADGQAYTAECYEKGWGVERNYESAFDWWMKAAEQEDHIAQYYVGEYFEIGRGTDIDSNQALFWYQKAAAQGDDEAIVAVDRLS